MLNLLKLDFGQDISTSNNKMS